MSKTVDEIDEATKTTSDAYDTYAGIVRPAAYAGCAAIVYIPPAFLACEAAAAISVETILSDWRDDIAAIRDKANETKGNIYQLETRSKNAEN